MWFSEFGTVQLSGAFVAQAETRWPDPRRNLNPGSPHWADFVQDAIDRLMLHAQDTHHRVRLLKSLDALKPYGLPA
jgi:hypothetical protein